MTGKTKDLFGPASAALLNAVKRLADIPGNVDLIDGNVIRSLQQLKTEYLHSKNPRLHTDEMLIALSMSAATNENARKAMQCLTSLSGCEVHTSVILSSVDEGVFMRLEMNLTSDPVYEHNNLYHK